MSNLLFKRYSCQMAFENFTEKEVRIAILKKIKPNIKNKKSKHWMGKIYINNEYFTTVKIPNNHSSNFGPSKAKNLAKQLNLNQSQYNEFVKCKLTGSDYYKLNHQD